MWSEVFDRKATDLLAVQDEVTRKVSQSLVLELLPGETSGTRKYARSSGAYDAYLKGRFFWHKQTSFAGADPHGELVAEEVRCRLAEAG